MEKTFESDDELILACRNGDGHAWERLLNKYERLVYSIPLNYGLSREDAADVVQTTFTSLIQSLDTLRLDSRLGSWLATVARRNTWRIITHARREDSGAYEYIVETAALPEKAGPDSLDRWEQIEWIYHGLTQLSERCRMLLLVLYFEPQPVSYADIAARLAIPLGSVGPTRARCLERLRQLLQEI
jgi:RNA polymerase sigma factor (sigma-70 family)